MPIGTLNDAQFQALSSIITLRARELVNNMVVMEVSGASKGRSGANAADTNHTTTGSSNFSVHA